MQATGGTYCRPTAPTTQGVYIGQASSTSSGIEMTALDETTIVLLRPGLTTKEGSSITAQQTHSMFMPTYRQLLHWF